MSAGNESTSRSYSPIGSQLQEPSNHASTCRQHHSPSPNQPGDASCSLCGETSSLGIVQELNRAYEIRINHLEANPSVDSDRQRIDTLKHWVKDLSEHNAQLVQVVQELEQEACHRVALLEGKLQESSELTKNSMDSSRHFNNCLQDATAERMKLEKRLGNLVSDARNLCRVIQQGRQYSNWNIDGMTFHEVNEGDIFGNSTLDQKAQLMLDHKDEQIRGYVSKIQALRDELDAKTLDSRQQKEMVHQVQTEMRISDVSRLAQSKQCQDLSCRLEDLEFRFDAVLREKKQLAEDLASVHRELNCKSSELATLHRDIIYIEKSAKDKQAALTAEVADKHDQISQLRRDTYRLEECCRQADMQTVFKDGVIKELRKEVKFHRSKVAELEEEIFEKNPDTDQSIDQSQLLEFGKHDASTIMACKEHQPIIEKQSKPRPKVSKFFQPNIGDYVAASSHASGDYNSTKPKESVKRSNSPPSKDFASRDGKVGAVVGDKHVIRIKSNLHHHHSSPHQ